MTQSEGELTVVKRALAEVHPGDKIVWDGTVVAISVVIDAPYGAHLHLENGLIVYASTDRPIEVLAA